jgi:hypothetical protein
LGVGRIVRAESAVSGFIKPKKSRPVAVIVLMALEVILAFLGFASGINFLLDPSGGTHGMDTTMLVTTPIRDFTLVGLFFVTCYGILPVLAILGLWKLPRWRWTDAVNKWTGRTGPGPQQRLQELS